MKFLSVGLFAVFVVFSIGCVKNNAQISANGLYPRISEKYKAFFATARAENYIKARRNVYKYVLEYCVKVLIGEDIFEKGRTEITRLLDKSSNMQYRYFFLEEINKVKVIDTSKNMIEISMTTALKYQLLISVLKKGGYKNLNTKALLEASALIRTESQRMFIPASDIVLIREKLKNKTVSFWYDSSKISLPSTFIDGMLTHCQNALAQRKIQISDFNALKTAYKKYGNLKDAIAALGIDYLIVFSDETGISRLNTDFLHIKSLITLTALKSDMSNLRQFSLLVDKTFKTMDKLKNEISDNTLLPAYLNILKKLPILQNINSFVFVFINSPSISYTTGFLSILDPDITYSFIRIKGNKAYFRVKYPGNAGTLKQLILINTESGIFENKFIFSDFAKKKFELTYKGVNGN
jgi:hypothetical protein